MKILFAYFRNIKRFIVFPLAGSLFLSFDLGAAGFAVEDWECLHCHQDLKLKQMLVTGALRSLYVNPEKWKNDVHHKKGRIGDRQG